jgi:hypothetical protein
MTLTDEQYQTLSKYETQFRTAVKAKWARFPGTAAMQEIRRIHMEVTKRKIALNTSCATCVLRMLTEMGHIFFADKAERERVRQVTVEDIQIPVQEKVEVKTRGRKPKVKK